MSKKQFILMNNIVQKSVDVIHVFHLMENVEEAR